MRRERITFGLRLPPSLHTRLLEIATEQRRSLNEQLVWALEEWAKLQPRRRPAESTR